MIKKMNSNEMNQILDNAINEIDTIKTNIEDVDNNINVKFSVLKNEQEFSLSQIYAIKELLTNTGVTDYSDKIIFSNQQIYGNYDKYGCCVHPKLSSIPVNMFNFITADGPFYKNNAVIKINNSINMNAIECLKYDTISDKEIFFNEYDSSDLTFNIQIDTGKLVGETKCNMIEIAPFISGSFEITDIAILTKESQLTGGTIPVSIMQDIGTVGHTRIMLDSTYNIYEIQFKIKLLFKNDDGKFPFGLKHIYFYNASFDTESYIIAKISKNNYIDTVNDSILLTTQNNKTKTSALDYGIKMYLNYDNDSNVLSNELNFSTDNISNEFAVETNEFYIKIPLDKTLYALQFLSINTR